MYGHALNLPFRFRLDCIFPGREKKWFGRIRFIDLQRLYFEIQCSFWKIALPGLEIIDNLFHTKFLCSL